MNVGLDVNGVRFLFVAARSGVDFSRFVSIGRQGLHLGLSDLRRLLKRFGHDPSQAKRLLAASNGFADPLLQLLGAKEIQSVDASPFEGASLVHDMNQPAAEGLKQRFSVVLDGGSLEHVFNFPTAIRNCMEMVEEGGHFLAITPANNFLGHGFYQFSPELFYRVLSTENGFSIERMLIFESRPGATWYEVPDPAKLGHRVELRNSCETYLLIQARRKGVVGLFASAPQQSDYAMVWQAEAGPGRRHESRLPAWVPESVRSVLQRARSLIASAQGGRYRGFDPAVFRPFRES